uniref:Peptidase S1 domain-containing protein n=1 Tax=Anopheles dirus TaxID=7168 RepID=A0A182NJK5_9DIPT
MSQVVVLLTVVCVACLSGLTVAQLRVVGGTDADIYSYSFVVGITFQRDLTGNGAIISKRWVLSAASTFYQTPHAAYDVFAGAEDYRGQATWYKVERAFLHPEWIGWTFNIALVLIRGSFAYTSRVQPINLASSDPDSLQAQMVSFGRNEDGTSRLREATFALTSDQSCVDQLTDYYAKLFVLERQGYCLLPGPGPAKGQWYNDVGAPIVTGNELYAVFAFNENAGGGNEGAVGTRIAFFRNWIQYTMGRNG